LPYWALDMDYRRGAEEALLAAIRLLGNGGMETHDGCHWDDASGVLGDVVAHCTANLGMGVVLFGVV